MWKGKMEQKEKEKERKKVRGKTEEKLLTEIIEENIKKEKGKVKVCFADLKAAFDKLKHLKSIWERLIDKKVERRIVKRLEEIYEETYEKIMIDKEVIDEFEISLGVRQGCPLSADLFNIAKRNGKSTWGRCKDRGKKSKINCIADDIVLLA